MAEKNADASGTPDAPAPEREGETERAAPRRPYKSPTISRHGNLRLMTQLE